MQISFFSIQKKIVIYSKYMLFTLVFISCFNKKTDININKIKDVNISCLDNYYKTTELLYRNGLAYKDSLKQNCNNYHARFKTDEEEFLNEDTSLSKSFLYKQNRIINELVETSNINTSNIFDLKYGLKDNSKYGCKGYYKQIIESFSMSEPFHFIVKDSVYYHCFLYNSNINRGTRIAISVFPISFIESVDNIGGVITCEDKCDFSFTIFFNDIPNCLCEWNKKNSNHPITNNGWMLDGDAAYLNDCLFDSALDSSN